MIQTLKALGIITQPSIKVREIRIY